MTCVVDQCNFGNCEYNEDGHCVNDYIDLDGDGKCYSWEIRHSIKPKEEVDK